MMPSRRTSAEWALPVPESTAEVDVLIPTDGRGAELAVTLAGLASQDDPPFRVILSDQSAQRASSYEPSVQAMIRVLRAQGRSVEVHEHVPQRGMAEQRQFLLDCSTSDHVLFLDDDVWLEPGALAMLDSSLVRLSCGFVGAAVQGLSYLSDNRPSERADFSPWEDGVVRPERMRRDSPEYSRWRLHNAANLAHQAAEMGLRPGESLPYKIAWIGGCVLYERRALVESGGFDFWGQLPPGHSGEDVAAEWRVMERFGGAGILPSGAVHLEAPTRVRDREVDAVDVVFHSASAAAEV